MRYLNLSIARPIRRILPPYSDYQVLGVPLAYRFRVAHERIPSAHYPDELIAVAQAILSRRDTEGDVAEFGCFKGGSTAKLSLACRRAGKRLLVFDSFEGLPEPADWDAEHAIERIRVFKAGEYAAALDEVRDNVDRYGAASVCDFFPGWFDETVSLVDRTLAVVFADVDLCESLAAVLPVWDRLAPGGVLFVHDVTDSKLRDQLTEWAARVRPAEQHLPSEAVPPHWTLAYFVKGAAS